MPILNERANILIILRSSTTKILPRFPEKLITRTGSLDAHSSSRHHEIAGNQLEALVFARLQRHA
jgi:hypothetical protein